MKKGYELVYDVHRKCRQMKIRNYFLVIKAVAIVNWDVLNYGGRNSILKAGAINATSVPCDSMTHWYGTSSGERRARKKGIIGQCTCAINEELPRQFEKQSES